MPLPAASKSRYARWSLIAALLTAILGIGISFHTRARIAETETNRARLTAETLRENTKQELNRFVEVLESVRALHALSDAVNQAAMDEFIEKGLVHQHSVLGAFGLAQQISHSLRVEIEQKALGQPGAYTTVRKGKNGDWLPSSIQSTYYPLTWQSRTDALNIPIGFDFSSIPASLHAIKRIEQTRNTSMALSHTPFSSNESPAYWVFSPVIPRSQNTLSFQPVIGFAVAEIRPEVILKEISSRESSASKLQLTPTTLNNSSLKDTIQLQNGVWVYESSLNAIGTQWIFKCTLPAKATDRRANVAFILGIIITALITSQLLLMAGQTRKTEATVRRRTHELHLANARLEDNLRERAQMEEQMTELTARERRRIGRDLHDSLGQKLTGAVFLSRSLLNYFSTHNNEQQTHARTLNETLKSSVAQVRNMARGLAAVTLSNESLCEALGQLAEEMTNLYAIPCELAESAEPPGLNRKTKEQLYLIAREAVNNAARHADAERIIIQLISNEDNWNLIVRDDGKGFNVQPSCEGMGSRIMRHRTDLIGAQFTIDSTPGKGTTITISGSK